MTETERVTDKTLRAWLNAGQADGGIGRCLTFVATTAGALKGQSALPPLLRRVKQARAAYQRSYRGPRLSNASLLTRTVSLAEGERMPLGVGLDVEAQKFTLAV